MTTRMTAPTALRYFSSAKPFLALNSRACSANLFGERADVGGLHDLGDLANLPQQRLEVVGLDQLVQPAHEQLDLVHVRQEEADLAELLDDQVHLAQVLLDAAVVLQQGLQFFDEVLQRRPQLLVVVEHVAVAAGRLAERLVDLLGAGREQLQDALQLLRLLLYLALVSAPPPS